MNRYQSCEGWWRLLVRAAAGALVIAALGAMSAAAIAAADARGGRTGPYAPLNRPGPQLSIPARLLRAALACTPGVVRTRRDPILLVPGTEEDPGLNFGWNYLRAFARMRWPYCTITLPGHTTKDI